MVRHQPRIKARALNRRADLLHGLERQELLRFCRPVKGQRDIDLHQGPFRAASVSDHWPVA